MQSAHQLRQFGATLFIADWSASPTTRELGRSSPAIVVAGRSGSAIAAEIGTMVVTEEIDALAHHGPPADPLPLRAADPRHDESRCRSSR